MKKLALLHSNNQRHWVGDGFPVRTLFSYADLARELSPFLLLDYAGPHHFQPTSQRRGVGEHPHRGFETVTIVYAGEVEHRDSSGGGGIIGAGDVQWMTAAAGLVHEEFHAPAYAARGGPFEVVQLWVNLAAKDKSAPPGYQSIVAAQIPQVELPGSAGSARVIAGRCGDAGGPARTFSPMNVWDLRLKAGTRVTLPAADGDTAALFVLDGEVANDGRSAGEATLMLFERAGAGCTVETRQDARALYLSGTPIDEPIVGYGPFVMNSEAEIRTAIEDYRGGRMGRLAARG